MAMPVTVARPRRIYTGFLTHKQYQSIGAVTRLSMGPRRTIEGGGRLVWKEHDFDAWASHLDLSWSDYGNARVGLSARRAA